MDSFHLDTWDSICSKVFFGSKYTNFTKRKKLNAVIIQDLLSVISTYLLILFNVDQIILSAMSESILRMSLFHTCVDTATLHRGMLPNHSNKKRSEQDIFYLSCFLITLLPARSIIQLTHW